MPRPCGAIYFILFAISGRFNKLRAGCFTPPFPYLNSTLLTLHSEKAGVRRKADTRFVYHSKNYIRLRYSASISSTLVSRGLPGQQASAKADSARK